MFRDYDPETLAIFREMAADGVSAEVLYPTLMLDLFALDDAALQEACFRVYNDWLIEYWAAASERFIPQCIVPLWPVEETVKEIRRAVALGVPAERAAVRLSREEDVNPHVLTYLNRLSDLLFVLARYVNKAARKPETPWRKG